jgi:hypothetical protein
MQYDDVSPSYALYRLYGDEAAQALRSGREVDVGGQATSKIESEEEAARWARQALKADDGRLTDTLGEESVEALRQVASLEGNTGGPKSWQDADPETREKMSPGQKVKAIRRDVASEAMGKGGGSAEPDVPAWSEIAQKERSELTVSQKVRAIKKDQGLGPA